MPASQVAIIVNLLPMGSRKPHAPGWGFIAEILPTRSIDTYLCHSASKSVSLLRIATPLPVLPTSTSPSVLVLGSEWGIVARYRPSLVIKCSSGTRHCHNMSCCSSCRSLTGMYVYIDIYIYTVYYGADLQSLVQSSIGQFGVTCDCCNLPSDDDQNSGTSAKCGFVHNN